MNLNTPRITTGPLTEADADAAIRASWPARRAAEPTAHGWLDDSELERQAEQARMAGADDSARADKRPGRKYSNAERQAHAAIGSVVVLLICIAAVAAAAYFSHAHLADAPAITTAR